MTRLQAIISSIPAHLNHRTFKEATILCRRKLVEIQKRRRLVIEIV
jgi:hypothetical protein